MSPKRPSLTFGISSIFSSNPNNVINKKCYKEINSFGKYFNNKINHIHASKC